MTTAESTNPGILLRTSLLLRWRVSVPGGMGARRLGRKKAGGDHVEVADW
jgi:hypothetical protein